MNITLSADSDTLKKTREYARQPGTSVNQLVRDFFRSLTDRADRDQVTDEFIKNATAYAGRSPEGYRFERESVQRVARGK